MGRVCHGPWSNDGWKIMQIISTTSSLSRDGVMVMCNGNAL